VKEVILIFWLIELWDLSALSIGKNADFLEFSGLIIFLISTAFCD
jgi:hypothetical protein